MKARRWRSNQVQGLYVHSSPPSEVAPNPSVIRQWLRGGEVDKLEAVVIQGLGHKLLGEYASDLKVRAFLKTVPSYLARIDMLHEAAAKGNLKDLQTLLKPSSDGAFTRKKLSALALSKDPSGSGLMHKAVYHGHRDMVKWLADHHPGTVKVRDREGRSPLHYCGRAPDPEWTWTALRQAGADAALLDARGRPPQHYMDHPEDAELPSTPSTVSPGRFTSGNNGLVVKPSNIRIWIHDRDLGRLAQVVWEGYGEKLRTETSQHAQVKTFLSAVPYMMGVIKDTHTAAINNDIILLRKRTEPPVPRQIVLAKDQNGLTPLHKAAGLGHVEMVRALLSACAEAVGVLDREGRAPLHHAAAARGSGATYDLLLEYGADENIMDKKGKAPSYYINNAKEIDHKQLTVIPEATRTSTVFPANWDWGGLRLDWLGAKAPKPTPPPPPNNGDSAFEDETPERNSSQGNEINNNSVKEPPTRPQTYDIDAEADEGMEEEEEEDKERGYIADSDEQEGHYEAEYEEVDPDYEVMNEPTTRGEGDTLGEVESPGENQEAEGERARGVEEKEEEEEEEEQSDGRESSADRHARLQRVVEVGSMEQLAEVVLTGDGELLARHRSSNPDVQLFIDNIPTYLRKIEKVHTATRHGNLRELQAALDRRKFAVARESKSTLRLSPLHVAVLYGRTAVVRFLASRFPETMKVGDSKGRTPLHYAATLNDNGHYYNLLADLGADTSLEDADGKTAEIYLHQPSHITHEQLLAEFEGRQLSENSQTSDKVDSDSFSARRDNDDVEIMAALDRCFKLILNPSYKTASVSLLGQFMTQQLFECYRKLLTKSDHSLLDVIRPGVKQIAERSFPMDESPIVLPDYESFVVFFDFVTPIILGLNSFQPYVDLIPHPQSNFESEVGEINLENINLDPSNKIILSSIIECSRNLKGVNFPCSLTLKALEEVELEVSSTLLKFYRNKEADKISIMREEYDIDDMNGVYCTVSEILENENEIHNQLESQLLLDPELKRERRRGRHWPYGRGVYIRPEIYLAVWINVQEHIKIRLSVGDKDKGRIGLMFTRLGELVTHLEEHFEFEQHETLGYLATDPQFVGNGLKFHVVLSLPFLGSDFYDLQQLCYVRGLSVELMPKRSEFHLKNRQSLGLSEIQSFKEFSSAVSNIIELEKSKSRDNSSKMSQLLKNFIKKGLTDGAVAVSGFPVFGQEEGQYLASSLGRPLIAGLTEVASRRPPDPVRYLANYLHNFEDGPENGPARGLEQNYSGERLQALPAPPPPRSPPTPPTPPTPPPLNPPTSLPPPLPSHNHTEERGRQLEEAGDEQGEEEERIKTPEPLLSAFKPVQRDEFGQMILHFAMARTHGRNAVLQMLQEVDCNIALRDELYRTPRDVALQVSLVDNVEAIDRFVVSLSATGQVDKLRELLLEGYDHILDTHDDQASIVEVANERSQTQVLAFLDSIASFEDRRERLHRAIRLASDSQVHEMLKTNPGLALAKNSYSRCSLHIAVLNQHDHIVQHIASHYPQTLAIGDNLLRTPLHYAMGVERVETLSRILIQAGAVRVIKDLKGRQPSYYFMNKSDVQKLQDEEDMLRV